VPLIAGASLDSSKDLILLVGLGALVLVGVFATELAGETWDLVQQEMRSDADARDEELSIIDADGTRGWGGMVGPLNTSAAAAWVERSVPVGVQDEVSAAWDGMRGFSEEQWEPAMEHALRKREARLAEEAKQADAIMDGTWLESVRRRPWWGWQGSKCSSGQRKGGRRRRCLFSRVFAGEESPFCCDSAVRRA
jgi:hypothetical protein